MSGNGPTTVSVIILNYNGMHLLGECLDAVFAQTYPPTEVIVVDNGSTDGSVEFLEKQYPGRIRLIRSSENLGFAAGNNHGMEAASGEFIALLNNDAVADPRWLEELVKAEAASGPDFGMWASKILFYDERNRIDTAGHLIYPDGLNRGRGKGEIDSGQYDRQEEVFFPSGCAALYRKAIIDELGGFDPDFFAYGDDTDLGLKARLAGWKCLFVPSSFVFHKSSATAGSYSPLKAYLVERNRVWILVKYFPLRRIILSTWYTLLRLSLQAYGALTGRGAAGKFVAVGSKAGLVGILLKAYIDACRGLPSMVRKRREFRKKITTSPGDFGEWLSRFRISAREISLRD